MNRGAFQWEGEAENGDYVFINYRGGHIKVGTASNSQEFWHPDRNSYKYNVVSRAVDKNFPGFYTIEDLKKYLEPYIYFKL